eukprot:1421229-Pleurochrysis_carterae.AAC.1
MAEGDEGLLLLGGEAAQHRRPRADGAAPRGALRHHLAHHRLNNAVDAGRQQRRQLVRAQTTEHLAHVDQLRRDQLGQARGHRPRLRRNDPLPPDPSKRLLRITLERQARKLDWVEDHVYRDLVRQPADGPGKERDGAVLPPARAESPGGR